MILVNGIPKSGTQLTKQLVIALTRYTGRTEYIPRMLETENHVVKLDVHLLRQDCKVFTCHCPHSDRLVDWLKAHPEVKMVHIIRDPRDQVVSHRYWIQASDKNPYHSLFSNMDADSALEAMIAGVGEGRDRFLMRPGSSFASLYHLYRAFVDWLNEPHVHTIRYEKIVGTPGGALCAAGRLAQFLGVSDWPPGAVQNARAIRGVTYRRGVAGGWRDEFNSRHERLYAMTMGELPKRLGYGSKR